MGLTNLRARARRTPWLRRAEVRLRFGDVRRTEPLTHWGSQRGTPVDRWYIEQYLRRHAELIRGRVLEVKSDLYASKFGASEVDVLDIDRTNEQATLIGDLCDESTLEASKYDAAVITQTLQLVADPSAAIRNLVASLRPKGALLITVPCLSRIATPTDSWRWVPLGTRRLLETVVRPEAIVDVQGMGNGLAARAFLFGLAAEDLDEAVLASEDINYPLIVGACLRREAPG